MEGRGEDLFESTVQRSLRLVVQGVQQLITAFFEQSISELQVRLTHHMQESIA
jgi:hypothetical protein